MPGCEIAPQLASWRRGRGIHWPDIDEDLSTAGLCAELRRGTRIDTRVAWIPKIAVALTNVLPVATKRRVLDVARKTGVWRRSTVREK